MSLVQSVQRQGEQPAPAAGDLLTSAAARRLSAACPYTGRPITARLPDGRTGEFMRCRSDCMRAALATLANVPYTTVPEVPREGSGGPYAVSQAIADLGAWARSLGYRLTWHDAPQPHRDAWIGGIPADADGPSHALVLSYGDVVHDPAAGYPLEPGEELIEGTLDQVTFGLTLELVPPARVEVWRSKVAA